MPAPLAKGLIISISILVAAGLAVYENPQVRQWVDQSRRKIAIVLHSLGDEIQPSHSRSRSEDASARDDASTREDESPEAVERRRKARNEILERGRLMEEKRRAKPSESATTNSFAGLVDEEGRLKKAAEAPGITTSADKCSESEGLRKRKTEGTSVALEDPFADEMAMGFNEKTPIVAVNAPLLTSPPTLPPKPLAYRSQTQLLDIDNTESAPSHSPSPLIDLAPTNLPSPAAHDDLSELSGEANSDSLPHPTHYHSVNEWAENSTASFYSPPQSETSIGEGVDVADGVRTPQGVPSDADTGEYLDHLDAVSDLDFVSEAGDKDAIVTPGSWTEIGSVVSEDDYRN